jgi:hypothetical protein
MPFIEVFDPNERSFYRGELHGITGKFASVIFEGAAEPTQVEARFIRPEAGPAPEGFTPQLNSSVEVLFHMPEQAPSYWEGTISNIVGGGKALVKFPNPIYTNIFDFSVMRPATGLNASDCVFDSLPVPSDCHDDFERHNKAGIEYVLQKSHLISLCFVPAKRTLAMYGVPSAVDEAKTLLSNVFAKSRRLNDGMKKLALIKGRSGADQLATVTFTIPTNMVGIVVGKEFKHVRDLKKSLDLKDVTFEKAADDESRTLVSVFADSKEKGELAKKHLHIVEEIVEIKDRSHIRSIIGQGGCEIVNMKQQTGVQSILVKDKEEPPRVIIAGLKDGVDQCVKMIEIICLYEPEFRSLESELQGAAVARGGGQRFQNFQDRQQRQHMRPQGHWSSEEFPELSSAQAGGKQKQPAVSVASSKSSARLGAAEPTAPSTASRRGGKSGSARGDITAAPAPAVEVAANLEEAAPAPRLRGGRGGRGRAGSGEAGVSADDAPLPAPPAAAVRGKKPASRGGRGAASSGV